VTDLPEHLLPAIGGLGADASCCWGAETALGRRKRCNKRRCGGENLLMFSLKNPLGPEWAQFRCAWFSSKPVLRQVDLGPSRKKQKIQTNPFNSYAYIFYSIGPHTSYIHLHQCSPSWWPIGSVHAGPNRKFRYIFWNFRTLPIYCMLTLGWFCSVFVVKKVFSSSRPLNHNQWGPFYYINFLDKNANASFSLYFSLVRTPSVLMSLTILISRLTTKVV
jgi:hypothetical protein